MDGVGALLAALRGLVGGQDGVHPIHLGRVLSTKPLAVRLGQIQLHHESLKVDPRCVYEPGQYDPPNPHLIRAGDEVLLVTPDGQTFVVVCKVVSA